LPKQLILYSTSHCHLCDLAEALLAEFAQLIELKIVEIADDDDLLARYGTRIPVLQRPDNSTELNWPFNTVDIAAFLQR
jgi:Glutaredoxin-like domain (DUF836)